MRLVLENEEIGQVQSLVKELADRYGSSEDPKFLEKVTVHAHELPRRLRQHLNSFRLHEPSSAICLVSGYPIDEEKIGATPKHWKLREGRSRVAEEEMALVLMGSLLGDCISWATQQDGYMVHDILPIPGMEKEQLGSSSDELLWWHTEDAFHEGRGDYLGMMCLRNIDKVPTTFLPMSEIEIDPKLMEKLFEPHYTIRPDESHLKKNKSDVTAIDGTLESAYQNIENMLSNPNRIPVLFGDPKSPYIRIDPYFMDPVEDSDAQEALNTLVREIDQKIADVVLEGGDFCFIDNFQGVHGRKPFRARYDGRDRWLKRINIARDLRRSRSMRAAASDRVIM
ncbi:MAG TPA: guanitoxin biosynthesis L-enduracididine beta-hydroxylase GntD [Thermoanaerobaculia bacterium]|nr:guanitoxin biosynthesis L-enduracididine beta-hydroxylase GntD [Thermoanaerobaculia bacterium]